MNHAKMSLAARRQKWLELVAEYRRRGISAALFCKEHGFQGVTTRGTRGQVHKKTVFKLKLGNSACRAEH